MMTSLKDSEGVFRARARRSYASSRTEIVLVLIHRQYTDRVRMASLSGASPLVSPTRVDFGLSHCREGICRSKTVDLAHDHLTSSSQHGGNRPAGRAGARPVQGEHPVLQVHAARLVAEQLDGVHRRGDVLPRATRLPALDLVHPDRATVHGRKLYSPHFEQTSNLPLLFFIPSLAQNYRAGPPAP